MKRDIFTACLLFLVIGINAQCDSTMTATLESFGEEHVLSYSDILEQDAPVIKFGISTMNELVERSDNESPCVQCGNLYLINTTRMTGIPSVQLIAYTPKGFVSINNNILGWNLNIYGFKESHPVGVIYDMIDFIETELKFCEIKK